MNWPSRFRRIQHATVDSTSERAFESLARGAARDGDVHVAEQQTAGRGRLGRRWESRAGEGLYLSLVALPPAPLPAPAITIAAGLAVLDAVRALGVRTARLRWPNDVMAGPAKLAGILVETRGLDPAAPHYVIGIGLNVRQATFSDELRAERPVTSLALEGADCELETALATLLAALDVRLDQLLAGDTALVQDYREAAGLNDEAVRVTTASGTVEGRIALLTFDTGLELVAADGTRYRRPLEFIRGIEAVETAR